MKRRIQIKVRPTRRDPEAGRATLEEVRAALRKAKAVR